MKYVIVVAALITLIIVNASVASANLASWQKPATVQLGNQYPVAEQQYGLSAQQSTSTVAHQTTTHQTTTCVWCEYGYQQQLTQSGTTGVATQSMPIIRIAPPEQQRNGIGANGIQLYYDAELVNILFKTAFKAVFGQNVDVNSVCSGQVAFETPIAMESIVESVNTMDDLKTREIKATAWANRHGETFAVAVAGSGDTVIADNNQILDTQWVFIIDSQGKKYNLLFIRVGPEFWLINPQ